MSGDVPVSIQLDRDRLFRWLFAGLILIEVLIVLLDAFISEFDYVTIGAARRFFNITREDGIANFFSSFQMLVTGGVLLLITLVVRRQSSGSSKTALGWGVVTGLFLFTGFDDATKLHERMGPHLGPHAWLAGDGQVHTDCHVGFYLHGMPVAFVREVTG